MNTMVFILIAGGGANLKAKFTGMKINTVPAIAYFCP
jgi:hypothetical protein